jgi:hypothetical protein
MGQMTDLKIAAWQKNAGIEPATGQYAEDLEELSQAAFRLLKIIEAERSGIRDGDGYWHGSDVMGGTLAEIVHLFERVNRRSAFEEAPPAAHDAEVSF